MASFQNNLFIFGFQTLKLFSVFSDPFFPSFNQRTVALLWYIYMHTHVVVGFEFLCGLQGVLFLERRLTQRVVTMHCGSVVRVMSLVRQTQVITCFWLQNRVLELSSPSCTWNWINFYYWLSCKQFIYILILLLAAVTTFPLCVKTCSALCAKLISS